MPMRRILLVLCCLTTGGCLTVTPPSFSPFSQEDTAPPPAPPPPPEGKRLADLVTQAFATAKLTGTPEVSAVHATHDSQWGDWMFCIGSSSPDQPMRYAVLIGHDAILEVRSSVLIDGCDKETYYPLAGARAGRR
jgi:hypothetical protein